jgi:TPR repeat protein
VQKNIIKAAYWYAKAAEQGYVEAKEAMTAF